MTIVERRVVEIRAWLTGRRIVIRSGEDPQRRGERTLLDRPAAQGLYQSVFCSTALLRRGFISADFQNYAPHSSVLHVDSCGMSIQRSCQSIHLAKL